MKPLHIFGVIILTALLWSSTFVGIRIGLTNYSPGALALFRFLVASLCMAVIYPYFAKKSEIRFKPRVELLLLGMLGIGIYNLALNYGEETVSAGVASFIIGLMPVITLVLSFIFLAEKSNFKSMIGVLMSLIGLLMMVFSEKAHGSSSLGMMTIFISTLSGAFYTILLKKYLKNYHPILVSAWSIWGGTLMLTIFSNQLVLQVQAASFQATCSALYLGIFPAAIAYICWCYVLNFVKASQAAFGLFIIPFFATTLAYIILKEEPSIEVLIGGIIALLGALMASVAQYHRKNAGPFATGSCQ